jgi:hypothetical protein
MGAWAGDQQQAACRLQEGSYHEDSRTSERLGSRSCAAAVCSHAGSAARLEGRSGIRLRQGNALDSPFCRHACCIVMTMYCLHVLLPGQSQLQLALRRTLRRVQHCWSSQMVVQHC